MKDLGRINVGKKSSTNPKKRVAWRVRGLSQMKRFWDKGSRCTKTFLSYKCYYSACVLNMRENEILAIHSSEESRTYLKL